MCLRIFGLLFCEDFPFTFHEFGFLQSLDLKPNVPNSNHLHNNSRTEFESQRIKLESARIENVQAKGCRGRWLCKVGKSQKDRTKKEGRNKEETKSEKGKRWRVQRSPSGQQDLCHQQLSLSMFYFLPSGIHCQSAAHGTASESTACRCNWVRICQ